MNQSELVRAFLDFLASGDIDNLAPLLSDDFMAAGTTLDLDKQQALSYLHALHKAFPDTTYNFGELELDPDGNTVRVPFQETGTHTGTLDLNAFGIPLTLPPTGRSFSLPEATFEFTIGDGQIVRLREHDAEGGGLRGALAQLGVSL